MKLKKRLGMMINMALAAGVLITGCGDPGGNASGGKIGSDVSDSKVSVSVIVGAHSNANKISVNAAEIEERIFECTYTYGTLSLIRCDGQPEQFLKVNIEEPDVTGLSESKRKSIAEGYRNEILEVLKTEGMARYAEVDTLESIRLSANFLKGVDDDSDKYLVVADTGVATAGYLNFSRDDLFNTPTEDIIAALAEQKAIPDLEGVSVTWLYAGQVAEPQERLSEVQKDKVIEIWSAVLEEAGAVYEFLPDSGSSTAYTDLPEVSLINADARDIEITPIKPVILDSESVTFEGDLAAFVDEERARDAISSVGQTLLDNPSNIVYVVGCTASSSGRDDFFLQTLSEDRAQKVADVLKEFGVSEDRMIVVGLGDGAPWHIDDLDDSGYQIEEYAEQNRCVVVLDTLDPEYGEKIGSYIEGTVSSK